MPDAVLLAGLASPENCRMTVTKGVSLGPYEVLTPIGAGGMGQVWRARDRRIRRDVAVKVLSEDTGATDEAVRRFEQEARAAGALNHPGLVTIFDVGATGDGAPYIVMELLDGETVREALDRAAPGPLPLRKTLEYVAQIAEALACAHEKGIIHRDLKPENLFITSDRRVKILDFGLAKLAETKEGEGKKHTGRHLTSAGIVVGTPGYMSPEQVRALPLDHRTDLFSLGTVFYEMLTGRSPFEGETVIEIMHAVLTGDPPPPGALVPELSPAIDAIVRHCMEKDPRERFQSGRDLAFQLRLLPEMEGNGSPDSRSLKTAAPRRRWRLGAAAALAAIVVAAGGFTLGRWRYGKASAGARTFRQLTSAEGLESSPTLAPDGKSFAYVSARSGNRDIWMQRVDGRTAINITSDSPDDDAEPAFSPDGASIAFRSERDGGGIFVMGPTGESVRRISDFGHNPSWSPDGRRIVVSTEGVELSPYRRSHTGELWLIDTSTGARRVLIQVKTRSTGFGRDLDAVQPSWSPHGKRIAFWGLSDVAHRELWTIDPDAKEPTRTIVRVPTGLAFHWNPVWSPDGKSLYFGSDGNGSLNLWRITMDEESGQATGSPEPVPLPASMAGNFAFSQNGDMVYVAVTRSYDLAALPFDARTGATGVPRTLFGSTEEIESFQPSPDGKAIAFTGRAGTHEDLFLAELDGTRFRQLTNDAAKDRSPSWSPDGQTLYFYSDRGNAYHVWSIHADGSGITCVTDDQDRTRIGARNIFVPNVSPDGRTLAVLTESSTALVHLDRPQRQRLEGISGVAIRSPKWSPDGRAILGVDDTRTPAGGRSWILVYSLASRRAEKVLDHGSAPQWLPDGRKIVFFEPESIGILDLDTGRVTTAPVTAPGVQFRSGPAPQLSRDGSTLYVRRVQEHGDVWIVRSSTQG